MRLFVGRAKAERIRQALRSGARPEGRIELRPRDRRGAVRDRVAGGDD